MYFVISYSDNTREYLPVAKKIQVSTDCSAERNIDLLLMKNEYVVVNAHKPIWSTQFFL